MPVAHSADAEIAYEVHGEGPALLFVQGVGLAGCAWAPQVDELSRDHRCIVLDNRGIGASRGEVSGLSVAMMADDGWAVLDALGVGRAHLIGHSLGGVIVQRMALSSPARVASLSFLCTFAGGRDLARPSARLVWLGMRSRLGTRGMRRRAFAQLIMPDPYLQAHGAEAVMSELESAFGRPLWQAPAIADRQLAALRAHDERDRLGQLSGVPSLVLSGRLDPIASHAANAALATGCGSVHRVFEDASHALPLQHPALVNAALREHVAAASRAAREV